MDALVATSAATMLTLREGQRIVVGPAGQEDIALLADFLLRLSPQSLRLRYLITREFTPESAWTEAERMVRGPATLIATPAHRAFAEAIGVAELAPDQGDPTIGHLALMVRDDWQGQGIGTALLGELRGLAPLLGIATLRADLRAENTAARRLILGQGLPRAAQTRFGETQIMLHLPE